MWYEWVGEEECREANGGAEGGDILFEGGFVNNGIILSSSGGESHGGGARLCMMTSRKLV